jgi:hypothetical protein
VATQRRHQPVFAWTVVGLIVLNLIVLSGVWPLAVLTIPASIYGCWYVYHWDRQRTHVALNYELDQQDMYSYQQLCAGLESLGSVARLRRVEARQVHGDWKHQAGTTTSLQMAPVTIVRPGAITWLETNVPVWGIRWRQAKLTLIFLPDRVLIEQGRTAATVFYSQLIVTTALGRFVEQQAVPQDARVMGYNWQYPNKDGGPDRRFKNNRQWPVLEVAYIGLQSPSGLTLMIQASNRQRAETFVQSVRNFRPLVSREPPQVS